LTSSSINDAVSFRLQGMYDMFIQTQQTSSVNGSSSSSSSSSSNTVHHSKKRKLEYNTCQPVIQHALVQSTSDYQLDNTGLQRYSVNGANTVFGSLHNNNALQKSSPNQQILVRASTIKLLDTYQRCGQKVSATSYVPSCCRACMSSDRVPVRSVSQRSAPSCSALNLAL